MDLNFLNFMIFLFLISFIFALFSMIYNKKIIKDFINSKTKEDLGLVRLNFDLWLHKNYIKDKLEIYKGEGRLMFITTSIDDIENAPYEYDSIEMKYLRSEYNVKVDYDHNSSFMDQHYYSVPFDYINSASFLQRERDLVKSDLIKSGIN